ncbi:hypothetical protein [Myxococcus sp. AM010]|uniref:hypothetical protein n=1 Tax=Myxococcus sp. AM010 TaxID=2745138 RepID=UPI0015960FFE|nr:hypothetical protein [Myxococcus sp. AM010]NVJ15178.1 hypothetical protein [Myxococcus sp. AM010]
MNSRHAIPDLLKRDGGILVRVDFLDAAGFLEQRGIEVPVADLRLANRTLAYFPVEGERPHALAYRSLRPEGDGWALLPVDPTVRLILRPLQTDVQRAAVRAWKRAVRPAVSEELDSLVARRGRARPARTRRPLGEVRFSASWHARFVDGRLRTVGVLLVGGRARPALLYRALDRNSSDAADFNRILAMARLRLGSRETFRYFVGSGNATTNEFSRPFDAFGPTPEAAAARLMHRLRTSRDYRAARAAHGATPEVGEPW